MLAEVTDFCRLIVLRHPELAAAHNNVAIGAGAAELSRRGRQRVVEWQEILREQTLEAVFAADQPQSSQAGQALARDRGLEVGCEPRLVDQSLGRWQGQPWSELVRQDPDQVRQFFGNFTDFVPPEGESLGQAVERALGWWQETAPEGVGKTFAVVGPGSILSGLAVALLGIRLSRSLSLQLPHGGIGVLDVFANGVRLSAWNVDGLRR